ncbi:uncharacterized protein [Drosophila bipectinata]|uniref:uncharacterized protein n=1 Tax=Drosophila bipectinata TaxID=42026 RepID=UPI001C8A3C13|nr:uncharacterized protein LOC108122038 [Drosophila bipectinata]
MKLNSKFDRERPTIIVVPLKMHRRCIICGREPSEHFVYPRNLSEARRWQSLVNMNSFNVEPESLCRHGCVCSSHLDVEHSSSSDLENCQKRSTGGMPPQDSRNSIDRRLNIQFSPATELFVSSSNIQENASQGKRKECRCDNCRARKGMSDKKTPPILLQPKDTDSLKGYGKGQPDNSEDRRMKCPPLNRPCCCPYPTNARAIEEIQTQARSIICKCPNRGSSKEEKQSSKSNKALTPKASASKRSRKENLSVKSNASRTTQRKSTQDQCSCACDEEIPGRGNQMPFRGQPTSRNVSQNVPPSIGQQMQNFHNSQRQNQQPFGPPNSQDPHRTKSCQVCVIIQPKNKDKTDKEIQVPFCMQNPKVAAKNECSSQTTATNCYCEPCGHAPDSLGFGSSFAQSKGFPGYAASRQKNNAINVLLMPGSRNDYDSCCCPSTFRSSAPAPEILVQESDLTDSDERAVFPPVDLPSYRVCRAATSDPKENANNENEACANVLVLEDGEMDCQPENNCSCEAPESTSQFVEGPQPSISSKETHKGIPEIGSNWMNAEATANFTKVLELQKARINELDTLLQQHNALQQTIQAKVAQLQCNDNALFKG